MTILTGIYNRLDLTCNIISFPFVRIVIILIANLRVCILFIERMCSEIYLLVTKASQADICVQCKKCTVLFVAFRRIKVKIIYTHTHIYIYILCYSATIRVLLAASIYLIIIHVCAVMKKKEKISRIGRSSPLSFWTMNNAYYRLIVAVVMEAVEVKLLVVVIDRLAVFTLVLQHFISMIFLLFSFFFLKGTN